MRGHLGAALAVEDKLAPGRDARAGERAADDVCEPAGRVDEMAALEAALAPFSVGDGRAVEEATKGRELLRRDGVADDEGVARRQGLDAAGRRRRRLGRALEAKERVGEDDVADGRRDRADGVDGRARLPEDVEGRFIAAEGRDERRRQAAVVDAVDVDAAEKSSYVRTDCEPDH